MDVYQRRRLVALAAIVGFVVLMIILISSCGSGDEPPTTTTGATGANDAVAMTKAQYINMADSICAENEATLDSLAASPIAADPVQFSSQRFDYVRGQRSQLKNLTPPEDDAEQLDTFFLALDEYTTLLRQSRGANQNADSVALSELSVSIPAASEQLRITAEDYGFTRCGQPATGATLEDDGTGGTADGGAVAPTDETPVAPAPDDTPPDVGDGGGGGGAGL